MTNSSWGEYVWVREKEKEGKSERTHSSTIAASSVGICAILPNVLGTIKGRYGLDKYLRLWSCVSLRKTYNPYEIEINDILERWIFETETALVLLYLEKSCEKNTDNLAWGFIQVQKLRF